MHEIPDDIPASATGKADDLFEDSEAQIVSCSGKAPLSRVLSAPPKWTEVRDRLTASAGPIYPFTVGVSRMGRFASCSSPAPGLFSRLSVSPLAETALRREKHGYLTGQAKHDRVFSNTAYYIDFYQRDYRWTAEPVLRLLDDVFHKFIEQYAQSDELDPSAETITAHYPWYYLNTYALTSSMGVST